MDKVKFKAFADDCKKIVDYCEKELGIDLANGNGKGRPNITDKKVWFNGSEEQRIGVWTTDEQISIPWPSDTAGIIDPVADPIATKTSGTWFAGNLVSQRVAPIDETTGKGSGSYETFAIDATEKQVEWRKGEKEIFGFTKTAYRPYDLTVTACLIAFKHHFGDVVKVSSDGEEKDWMDGRVLCNNVLGYGLEMEIFSKDND